MSRFELHPVTREPYRQEPPEAPAQADRRRATADGAEDLAQQKEREREQRGNRGPDEEPGFGQGA